MPVDKTNRAQTRINQWMTDQNAEGQDGGTEVAKEPKKASGSGLTDEERQKVTTVLDESKLKKIEISEKQPEDAVTAEDVVELEGGPEDPSQRRVRTPERNPAVKRGVNDEGDAERLRRRIHTPTRDDGMNDEHDLSSDSPLQKVV